PAETLTLYGADDIRLRRAQIDEGNAPPERRDADHGRLNALLGLAEALECRRTTLLAYFGETGATCGFCDLCDTPPETFDATESVRKALSAALRTGESFGTGHLIDVLIGHDTDKIRKWRHDDLPTFGVGKDMSRPMWQAVFRQMMGHDLLRPDADRHGALVMTDAARPLLRGEASIHLRRDTLRQAQDRRPAVRALVSEDDAPLLSALKAKRRALAEAARVPAYVIFTDRTLIEMAETRPASLDDMARIGGVGVKKLERYGMTFLEVITGASADLHPTRRRLATGSAGALYDALLEVQTDLARGPMGTDKPLSCSAGLLAKLAKLRPDTPDDMARLLGDRRAERFGAAFLDVIARER
ncbi:MAG: RQC domain-containing protein, partial [Paracoccaceae bacterium]